MRIIKKLSDEIKGNIHEAESKIKTAYKMRETDKAVADWYKEMAVAHMNFNVKGHELVKQMIADAKAKSGDNPMAPGMLMVYQEIHAEIAAESAEVQGMISAYK